MDNLFEPMKGRDIDRRAAEIILDYQPGALRGVEAFDIRRFLDVHLEELASVDLLYSSDLPPGVYGITDPGNATLEIDADLANDNRRENFYRSTAAHEAGHCILHVPRLRRMKKSKKLVQAKGEEGKIRLFRDEAVPIYLDPEWQAWRFAGALLMPETAIRALDNNGYSKAAIASILKVSTPFLEVRLRSLKLNI